MGSISKLGDVLTWKLYFIFMYSLTVFVSHVCRTYGDTIDKKVRFYNLNAIDINGKTVSLNSYKGKVLLIVNVATYCGFTQGHYKDLVAIQDKFGRQKFSVLAFPCNQFGEQEPDSNEEIIEFLRDVYKVNFPIFRKIEVKGENSHPLFKYLTDKTGKAPTWNFWKYLVDHNGSVLNAWGPMTSVDSLSEEIKNALTLASKPLHSDEL